MKRKPVTTSIIQRYNPTTCETEKFVYGTCRRCKGHGATLADDGNDCFVCDGNGEAYQTYGAYIDPKTGEVEII